MAATEAAGLMSWLWILLTLISAQVSSAANDIIGAAEAVPTPTPTPAPPTPHEGFLSGYRAGGGDPAWEQHWLDDVIPCESQWGADPPGIHYGLAQFEEGTWTAARCSPNADYRDPWEQGCAVANWMSLIPGRQGTTAGWPVCWWRGL